jgi:NADPH:quinone reductase
VRTVAARLVEHGKPLSVEEVEVSEPGPDEVVIDGLFGGVNPVDRYAVQGRVAPNGPLPRTLGSEAVGTVDGRTVLVRGHGLGAARDGLWAGVTVAPRSATIDVPVGVDPAAAAAMGVAGATAWRVVTDVAAVGPDDRVLVLGASGGVGGMTVSLVHNLGATVWGQTGNPDNSQWIRDRGADDVVVGGPDELAGAADGLRPTVVIDGLGGGFSGAAVELLEPHGRLVIFGTSADPRGELSWQSLYRKSLTVRGYGGLIEPHERVAEAARQALQALAARRMEVVVDDRVPLAHVNEALDRLGGREVRGKLVLDLRSPSG